MLAWLKTTWQKYSTSSVWSMNAMNLISFEHEHIAQRLSRRERAEINNAKGKTLEISMASRSNYDLVNIEGHRYLTCD